MIPEPRRRQLRIWWCIYHGGCLFEVTHSLHRLRHQRLRHQRLEPHAVGHRAGLLVGHQPVEYDGLGVAGVIRVRLNAVAVIAR